MSCDWRIPIKIERGILLDNDWTGNDLSDSSLFSRMLVNKETTHAQNDYDRGEYIHLCDLASFIINKIQLSLKKNPSLIWPMRFHGNRLRNFVEKCCTDSFKMKNPCKLEHRYNKCLYSDNS